MGMDSLMTVAFKERLEADLDRKLSVESIFNYPTVDSLADYIATEVLDLESQEKPAADSGQVNDDPQQSLNKIKQLSDAELENLIDKNLQLSDQNRA